jgi:hypothetical protein
MPRAATLTLIVPDVRLDPVDLAAAGEGRWPQLARLAGRGRVARTQVDPRALRPWQTRLLQVLSLDDRVTRHASAPLSRLGYSATRSNGFWMHADLVHLAAGLDRLTFLPLAGATAITPEERGRLRDVIEEHLAACGFALHDVDGGWLVESATPFRVATSCPEAAVEDLEAALPQGEDAVTLRRTMTEVQMLLHEHPVNLARARRNQPPANALWFWGSGMFEPAQQMSLPAGFGDDAYLRGLYCLYGASVSPPAREAEEFLARLPARQSAVYVASWNAIDAIEDWIAPLSRALASGRLAHVEILLGDRVVSADRLSMLRFWRRPAPPAQWVA